MIKGCPYLVTPSGGAVEFSCGQLDDGVGLALIRDTAVVLRSQVLVVVGVVQPASQPQQFTATLERVVCW